MPLKDVEPLKEKSRTFSRNERDTEQLDAMEILLRDNENVGIQVAFSDESPGSLSARIRKGLARRGIRNVKVSVNTVGDTDRSGLVEVTKKNRTKID